MNQRKKVLWGLLGALGLLGMAGASIPFFRSLSPSASSGADLPHIDVSKMSAGQYIKYESGFDSAFGEIYFIVKEAPEKYRVFFLATQKGNVVLPDIYGSFSGLWCSDFRPDSEGAILAVGGYFRCHDGPEQTWGYDGRHHNDKWSADLPEVAWSLSGKHLVIGKG